MRPHQLIGLMLGGSTLALVLQTAALAQSPAPPQAIAADEDEAIVVTGQRERGSVLGDIAPEQQLRPADIRALGVSNVAELLAELAPQLRGAGSGGQPVVLLEGRRISGFQEIANLPSEAIARVDILPEAVALRYGFAADQRVVNFVLRERFRTITAESATRLATGGGTATHEGDLGLLRIGSGRRISLDAELQTRSALLEDERGLVVDPAVQGNNRALIPWLRQFTLNGSYAHPFSERLSATVSGQLTSSETRRQTGLARGNLLLAPGTPFNPGATSRRVDVVAPFLPALVNHGSSQTGRLALTVQREGTPWRWTATAAYDRAENRTISGRGLDVASLAAAMASGVADADPALPLAPRYAVLRPADDARSQSDTARVDATASGVLGRLPAGDATASVTLIGSVSRFSGVATRSGLLSTSAVARDLASAQGSIDLPIARRSRAVLAPLGDLSLNANATVQSLSDAGTLRTMGAGFNWSPLRDLSLVGTYSSAEGAPTANQIGDPQSVIQAVSVFDFVRGTSAIVSQLTGGNPLLRPSRRETFRLNASVKAGGPLDVTLSAALLDERIRDAITSLPSATAAVQAAFPERFTRDATGALTAIDTRPVNLALRERRELRLGISISKPLKTPQWQIDAMRAAMARRAAGGVPGGSTPDAGRGASGAPGQAPGTDNARQGAGAGGFGRGGGGPRGFGGLGGMGGGGGGQGGRLNLALYHTWNLVDRATLRAGLPAIDLLNGGTLGSGTAGGGIQPRHEIELQGGVYMAGVGLRITGNWQSAARVNSGAAGGSGALRYAPLARFNLRLFANTGALPGLGLDHRWLRGTRVQIGVDNILNARPSVTDATGATPFALQGANLDPLGRTVRISLRKLFF